MRIALIVDDLRLAQWQREALERCGDSVEVALVLNCTNTRVARRPVRNALYYLINLLFMRGPWRRSVPLPDSLAGVEVIDFESEYRGRWQVMPDPVVEALARRDLDAAVKFGMDLLAGADGLPLKFGVLSFHHGDPSAFRGRPAGFHELLARAPHLGVIVQRITDRLDAGAVYAFAKCKIEHHSYRATLANAYRNSVPLLAKAFANLAADKTVDLEPTGKAHTLPSNLLAVRFLGVLAWRTLKRLVYGAFFEKRWNVASCAIPDGLCESRPDALALTPASVTPIARDYAFYADPFPLDESRWVVEALDRRTGRGVLVAVDADTGERVEPVVRDGRHRSYPSVVRLDGATWLLPEIAVWSAPMFLRLDDESKVIESVPVAGLEDVRLVDPTYLEHDGVHYIFGGTLGCATDNLEVFVSTASAFGPYAPHPLNPVVIDPATARMGGAFLRRDGCLYRLGQNNTYAYGDGLTLLEVVELSPETYRERPVRAIRVRGAKGPHTFNVVGEQAVFDLYRDRFSLMAGVRRLRAL